MRLASIAPAAALLFAAAPAHAQVFRQTLYSVEHNFTLRPDPAATNVQISVLDFRHAWARKHTLQDWDVVSAVQDPDFDPLGTDTFLSPSSFNSGLMGSPVACRYDLHPVPTSGLSTFVCTTADLFPTFAAACNEWDIPPYSLASPVVVSGLIRSSGGAQASLSDTPYSEAYAFSSTAVIATGNLALASGQMQWGVILDSDAVGGGAGTSALVRRGDPVHLIAENLNTGQVVDAVLLSLTLDVSGNGHADWGAGVFDTDADEVTLIVDIPPTYVQPAQAGRIEFRIQGGVVTVASAGGAFAGMLPPVGTATPLAFPLPNDFTLDYDLGLNPADPWEVTGIFSGGGDTNPRAVDASCPADVNGDGILNLDDVDAFVGAFLGGDVALADLDGNGVINLDDLDTFVASFLGGCVGDGEG